MTENGQRGSLIETEVASAIGRLLRTSVDDVTRVSGFVGNQDFLIRTGAGDFVLKAGNAINLAAEAWACERVRTIGVLAPEVVALDLDREHLPEPFLLMRRMRGAGLTGADAVLAEAGRQLRLVHSIPADGFGYIQNAAGAMPTPRGSHDTWAGFVAEPTECLGELLANDVIQQGLADRVRAVLKDYQAAIAYDAPGVLLHGDLHPRHVYTERGAVSGIIDWGDVAAGDPLFDLGRFSLSGSESLAILLDGYGLALDDALAITFTVYRVIWSTLVLREELRAGGDWFAVRRQTIEADLVRLG